MGLSNGQASLTTTLLTPGGHGLTAVYSGDANFTGGSSSASAVSVSPDVTNLVLVGVGRVRRRGRHFEVLVTLRNVSGSLIPFPVLLALDKLGAGARLLNGMGVTHVLQPVGSPLTLVSLQGALLLPPGETVTATLKFSAASAAQVHFTARVLAGTVVV